MAQKKKRIAAGGRGRKPATQGRDKANGSTSPLGEGATDTPQRAAKKREPFAPFELESTVIALPLLQKINEERPMPSRKSSST